MTPLKDLRKVEYKTASGSWIRCQMGQLEPGDIFRITDTNNKLVEWKGATEFICKKPAAIDADPVGTSDTPPSKKVATSL